MLPDGVLGKLKVPMWLVHMKDRTYINHLLSVYEGLKVWGLPPHVQMAGLLHSIYGTERFTQWNIDLSRRREVADLVGSEAELLAYASCAIVRVDFDEYAPRGHRKFANRFGGEINFASGDEFSYFCAIHLCDWLDQVEISKEWSYRIKTYRWIADFLGGLPLAAFRWTYRRS